MSSDVEANPFTSLEHPAFGYVLQRIHYDILIQLVKITAFREYEQPLKRIRGRPPRKQLVRIEMQGVLYWSGDETHKHTYTSPGSAYGRYRDEVCFTVDELATAFWATKRKIVEDTWKSVTDSQKRHLAEYERINNERAWILERHQASQALEFPTLPAEPMVPEMAAVNLCPVCEQNTLLAGACRACQEAECRHCQMRLSAHVPDTHACLFIPKHKFKR